MKKSELALLYFPDSTVAVATNRLMRWVHDCDGGAGSSRLSSFAEVAYFPSSIANQPALGRPVMVKPIGIHRNP